MPIAQSLFPWTPVLGSPCDSVAHVTRMAVIGQEYHVNCYHVLNIQHHAVDTIKILSTSSSNTMQLILSRYYRLVVCNHGIDNHGIDSISEYRRIVGVLVLKS